MTKPVEPVSPAPKVGEGKSFLERMERGMKNDDPETKRQFAEKLEKYVNEGKALKEARNEHKKVPGLSRAGGAGGDFSGMKGLDKPFKKGGKVKKFNDGGMSLEEKYPGAKITRAGPQPKPVEQPPKTILQEALREVKEAEYKDLSRKAEKAPYEHKAEKFEKTKGGGGGGSGIPKVGSRRPLDMKKGGKVKSASTRGDGCAKRGKTKGKMV